MLSESFLSSTLSFDFIDAMQNLLIRLFLCAALFSKGLLIIKIKYVIKLLIASSAKN